MLRKLSALALATTGAATGMPAGWVLAVGAAGAIGHTVTSLRDRLSARTVGMRAASWLVGAGWTTWAITSGPLTWAALGSLATLGVGIGAAARSTLLHEEARELESLAAAERQVARELSADDESCAAEVDELTKTVDELDTHLTDLLAPRDPHDADDIVLEVR